MNIGTKMRKKERIKVKRKEAKRAKSYSIIIVENMCTKYEAATRDTQDCIDKHR